MGLIYYCSTPLITISMHPYVLVMTNNFNSSNAYMGRGGLTPLCPTFF